MNPTVSTLHLATLASGDRLSLQVYQFKGAKPGKKAYVQANLHGAEIAGNAVIAEFLNFLTQLDATQLAGEIWLVPVCNPMGVNQRSHQFSTGRYNPYDGKDWNRIFWDYEAAGDDIAAFARSQLDLDPATIEANYRQKILDRFRQLGDRVNSPRGVTFSERYRYRLQSLCLDANYVIDLHSSTNRAIDYLYCFREREESAKAWRFDYGILMNEYDGDAFDEAFLKPWLALEKALAELGKPTRFEVESWTLELGTGMTVQPDSVARGVRGLKNYLVSRGMLEIPDFAATQQAIALVPKDRVQRYYAPTGGILQWHSDLGESVESGQLLYQMLGFDKTANHPTQTAVRAENSGIIFDISTNQSANEGEYVLGILPNI